MLKKRSCWVEMFWFRVMGVVLIWGVGCFEVFSVSEFVFIFIVLMF